MARWAASLPMASGIGELSFFFSSRVLPLQHVRLRHCLGILCTNSMRPLQCKLSYKLDDSILLPV